MMNNNLTKSKKVGCQSKKVQLFLQKPQNADILFAKVIICNYENKPIIINAFYSKRREPFMYRMESIYNFSVDELIQIMKVIYWEGGEINDEWYDCIGKRIQQIEFKGE